MTEELRDELDREYFISTCMNHITGCLQNSHKNVAEAAAVPAFQLACASYAAYDISSSDRIYMETHEVAIRLREVKARNKASITILQRLNKMLITRNLPLEIATPYPLTNQLSSLPPNLHETSPDPLYRLDHSGKASSYYPDLGVLSSSWRRHDTPDHSAYRTNFINHLDRQDTCPTPFISVSGSPARIVNYSLSEANLRQELNVLVISPEKLQALGIPMCRTTTLASALDISRRLPRSTSQGVEFLTESHWLVDWWIPQECIEAKIDLADFAAFCQRRVYYNESRDKYRSPCDQRPPLQDILDFQKEQRQKRLESKAPAIPVTFIEDE